MNATDFWAPMGPRGNAPVTEALIREAEELLGRRLPPAYIDLLRQHNGGPTRGWVCPTAEETAWAPDHVPVEDLAGIHPENAPPHLGANILSSARLAQACALPDNLMLLSGDGHWWIALDYRRGEEPSVAWLDKAHKEDIQLAPAFDRFLDVLRPVSDLDPGAGVFKENVAKYQAPPDTNAATDGTEWTCPACGESSPANFTQCWSCNAERDPNAQGFPP